MRNAPDITNVVEACNLDGRQERLENMLTQLEMCEKALQVCVCVGGEPFNFSPPPSLLD